MKREREKKKEIIIIEKKKSSLIFCISHAIPLSCFYDIPTPFILTFRRSQNIFVPEAVGTECSDFFLYFHCGQRTFHQNIVVFHLSFQEMTPPLKNKNIQKKEKKGKKKRKYNNNNNRFHLFFNIIQQIFKFSEVPEEELQRFLSAFYIVYNIER